jgi:hypothetical protein
MGILELLNATYSNTWFTVPRKNRSLRLIQNLQLVNKMRICNDSIGSSIDKFFVAFNGRSIYSMGDLDLQHALAFVTYISNILYPWE